MILGNDTINLLLFKQKLVLFRVKTKNISKKKNSKKVFEKLNGMSVSISHPIA
jgi:hypothetical protein